MAFWDKIDSRGEVEDRRSAGPAMGGLGLTGIAIVALMTYLSGGSPLDIVNQVLTLEQQQSSIHSQSSDSNAQDEFAGKDSYEVFTSTVLGSNNAYWQKAFAQNNKIYSAPKLVLFRGATDSACGGATSEVGPHYCPGDETIYLDETFFDVLSTRFGAKGGDVAQAYVIAHEVGHHTQNILGALDATTRASYRSTLNENELSVQKELQADCYAGLWAGSLKDKNIFEKNEISEAIDAAAAVGDDRIQRSAGRGVNPETWTHGSSEQRVRWFTIGYESNDIQKCDTFTVNRSN